jgi:hypothetical protein
MASAPVRVAVAPMNFCLPPVVRSTFVRVRLSPGVTLLSPPRPSPELEFRQKAVLRIAPRARMCTCSLW